MALRGLAALLVVAVVAHRIDAVGVHGERSSQSQFTKDAAKESDLNKRHDHIVVSDDKVLQDAHNVTEGGHDGHDHHASHQHHHSDCAPDHGDEDHGRCSFQSRVGSLKLWLSATGSVLIISLCGVFGVLVIPIMHRIFYQHLIQFLVALAVGTLAGDAVLHLLPHALMHGIGLSHEQHEKFQTMAAWKGFFALMAFVVFYLLERLINMIGEWREHRKRNKDRMGHKQKKVHVVRSGHRASDKVVGEICKHKYSSYCVTDIDMDGEGDSNASHKPQQPRPGNEEEKREESANLMVSTSVNNESVKRSDSTYDTVFVHNHEHAHHGHSHAHSHLHSRPESISAVGETRKFSGSYLNEGKKLPHFL